MNKVWIGRCLAVGVGLALLVWLIGVVGQEMISEAMLPAAGPGGRATPVEASGGGDPFPLAASSSSLGEWWVWTNPLPVGTELDDVESTSSGAIFAVGWFGVLMRYDPNDRQWRLAPLNVDEFAHGVWAYDDQHVFAVGEKESDTETAGIVYFYDGSSWSQMDVGTVDGLWDVWGTSPSNVFAVGANNTILHYDGSRWTSMASNINFPSPITLLAVWGSSASDVFAAGTWGVVVHYDGSQWTQVKTAAYPIYDLWGSSGTDVYAPAGFGHLFHYDGSDWNDVAPSIEDYLAIWGRASDDFYVAGSLYGLVTLHHYDGITWTMPVTFPRDIYALNGRSNSVDLYGVGDNGYIFRYDGSQAERLSYGVMEDINDVWGFSEESIFAVGDVGTLLRYEGDRWVTMTTGITKDLYDIWGSAESDLFAVGGGGTILRYDGSAWSPMNSGTAVDLNGIWGTSSTNVIAVGANGAILRYDGSAWSPMNSGTTGLLVDVWGQGNEFFAVEYDPNSDVGTVLHYDGSAWSPMDFGDTGALYAVWGSSPSDVYVTAYGGAIFHYNGSQWEKIPTQSPTIGIEATWYAVWGRSAKEVYIAGRSRTRSRLMRYDGQQFTHIAMPHSENPYGIWGTDDWIFVVGGRGTIVRYRGFRSYLPLVVGNR